MVLWQLARRHLERVGDVLKAEARADAIPIGDGTEFRCVTRRGWRESETAKAKIKALGAELREAGEIVETVIEEHRIVAAEPLDVEPAPGGAEGEMPSW